jgi:hypothetical protein
MAVALRAIADGRELARTPRKGFNAQAGARVASRQNTPVKSRAINGRRGE